MTTSRSNYAVPPYSICHGSYIISSFYATRSGVLLMTSVRKASNGIQDSYANPPTVGSNYILATEEICLIAPYHANLDISTQSGSGVFTKLYTSDVAADVAMIAIIRLKVQSYLPSNFAPQMVYIVTWYKVKTNNNQQTGSIQAIVISDYLNTYYYVIYHEMLFATPLASPSATVYPARVAIQCKATATTVDIYEYDYSQLSISEIENIDFIERIDGVYQLYVDFQTVIDHQITQRKTPGQIKYLRDSNVPSYAVGKGIFFYALNTKTSEHPVTTCKKWLDDHSAITTTDHTKCPGTFTQMPASIIAQENYHTTNDGYDYYFIPSQNSAMTGKVCGYNLTDGTFADPTNHLTLAGKNLYILNTTDTTDEMDSYSACCIYGNDLSQEDICLLYLAKRPACTSENYVQAATAASQGDPHLMTMDEVKYTFNGHGEFILMKRGTDFQLQGRAERAMVSGVLSDATVFTSIAASDAASGEIVEMKLNTAGDDIVTYVSGVEVTLSSTTPTVRATYQLQKTTDTGGSPVYRMVFFIGIVVNIIPGTVLLNVIVGLGAEGWTGQTTGLMGNYNGDKTDEFILPDGTNIGDPASFTEAQIYTQFGQLWRVTSTDSLFMYDTGESWETKNDVDFTPIFFNPDLVEMFPDADERTQAIELCFGVGLTDPDPALRRECYFDFAVFKDPELAGNTASGVQAVQAEQAALANFPPVITNGGNPVQVIAGQSYSSLITLAAEDQNGDAVTFSVVDGSDTGVSVDSNSGLVGFIDVPAVGGAPFVLKISATDGIVQTIWEPKIQYCACENSGVCDFSQSPLNIFSTVACVCAAGWDGSYCERDKDGCADFPCFTGVACTDVPVALISDNPAGFTCSACPLGLEGNGQRCAEIDECLIQPPVCSQICTNEVYGYGCSCNLGYIMQDDLTTCLDVDECARALDNCDSVATCANTEGSFTCTCMTGYTDIGSGTTGQCQDTNECNTDPCPVHSQCQNSVGSFVCPCDDGYQYNTVTNTCDNIDDCELQNVCEQLCEDGLRMFTCACRDGYSVHSTDDAKCVPDNVCNAEQGATCNLGDFSIATCTVVNGEVICACFSTYAIDTSGNCVDIDECTVGSDACVSSTCTNTLGGYTCACNTGYQFEAGSELICADVNECLSTNECVSPANCINNPGAYTCSCPSGYTPTSNGFGCDDNDECASSVTNDCDSEEGDCTNTNGGYTCSCLTGYTGDGFTCSDLNECKEPGVGGCEQGCTNSKGSYTCFCGNGYVLNADELNCDDVDECSSSDTNSCYDNTFCTNIAGGYTCTCPTGLDLRADGVTCKSIDQCDSGNDCMYDCNMIGNVKTCICDNGFELNVDGITCDNINECELDRPVPLCPPTNNVICINTVGSYECVCKNTFYRQLEANKCINIDECLNNPCPTNSKCEDLEPNYNCTCLTGYTFNVGICSDVNECSDGSAVCHSTLATCTNTDGGYTCTCNSGYKGNGILCFEQDECSLGSHDCSAVAICTNTDGSFTCTCPAGYISASDGKTCIDVDECIAGTDGCADTCQNTIGSFVCTCQVGFTLAANQKACVVEVECESTFAGTCADGCARLLGTNTCTCSGGFILNSDGTSCDDVDECSGVHTCATTRGVCTNTDGGYTCSCTEGYTLGSNNLCNERDGGLSSWTQWSGCSVTCRTGAKTRSRECTNPTMEGNGSPCTGDTTESTECTLADCPVSTEEENYGIVMELSGITFAQFEEVIVLFQSSTAAGINSYCNQNEGSARFCCDNILTYSSLTSFLQFLSATDIIIIGGQSSITTNGNIKVLFMAKFDSGNTLCASGTTSRRKRAVGLTSTESLMTQVTLLQLVTTQQPVILSTFTTQAEAALGTTLTMTIEYLDVIDAVTIPVQADTIRGTPAWVIAVAVVGSILLLVLIIIVILIILKMNTKNKIEVVDVQEAEQGRNTQSDSSQRISNVRSEESRSLLGSTEQGQARRRPQRSSGGVVTLAPIEDPDLSHV